jgi:hypothetical protein
MTGLLQPQRRVDMRELFVNALGAEITREVYQ